MSGIGRGWTVRPGSATPSTWWVLTKASTTDRVELDAGELAQLAERLLGGQRRHPVGAGGRHGLEGVGDVEDAGELAGSRHR